MFRGHYDGWTESRMSAIKKYINKDFFKDKSLLELGGGYSYNGNKFYELGANVTSSDVEQSFLNFVYPHIPTFKFDCDKDILQTKYDIILHWGVLYHLDDIETHLKNVCENCDFLLLETEVSDSDNVNFIIKTKEQGYDQAYNNIGSRPSPSYIENILKNNDFNYKIIIDPIVNSDFHIYDWEIKNTNSWTHGLRRFWICWKNNIDTNNFLN
jgi:hypothetical protein